MTRSLFATWFAAVAAINSAAAAATKSSSETDIPIR
jgi:hypothetical protein